MLEDGFPAGQDVRDLSSALSSYTTKPAIIYIVVSAFNSHVSRINMTIRHHITPPCHRTPSRSTGPNHRRFLTQQRMFHTCNSFVSTLSIPHNIVVITIISQCIFLLKPSLITNNLLRFKTSSHAKRLTSNKSDILFNFLKYSTFRCNEKSVTQTYIDVRLLAGVCFGISKRITL